MLTMRGFTDGEKRERKKTYDEYLRKQLVNERSTFIPLWFDLGDYCLPSGLRYYLTQTNRADRRNLNIYDDTATNSADVLRSGMLSGMTSPTRPWFRLTTPDPDLAMYEPVKEWLSVTADRMSSFFGRSNLYQALPINYGNAGVFGTAAMVVEEDFQSLIRCYPLALGSFMIANNERMGVEVFCREFRMTVRQIIQKFGIKEPGTNKVKDWSNISVMVKNLYDNGNYETWIDLVHLLIPNEDYDPKRIESKYKKFVSRYYERGSSSSSVENYFEDDERYLSEKGYDYFPVLAPRWEMTAGDAYGTSSPGIRSLGDTKQLQHGEERALQAIDKMVTPPMGVPVDMRNSPLSHLPGGTSYITEGVDPKGIKSLYDVTIDLSHLDARQEKCRQRIERAFYKPLFQQFINDARSGTSATEIRARQEEQLLQLGPVVSQLNEDQNDRLIEIGFSMMMRQGSVPPPPPELHGMPLKIEYISPMVQAQKLIGLNSVERFMTFAGNIVKIFPDTIYKFNGDRIVDVYGDQLGLAPGIVRPEDEAQELQQQAAQARQQQAMLENMRNVAGAAKDASQADMGGDSALSRLAGSSGAGGQAGAPQ